MNSPAGTPKPIGNVPAPKRKKSLVKWIVIGGVVLLAVAIGLGVVAKKRRGAIVMVTTEKAIVKTITQTVSATGKVQPEVEVKIAPEVSGEIVKLGFREGAVVKKGDLLVAIKPDLYAAQVEQQEANLVAARAGAVQSKAQLLKAQEDLTRTADLFAKKLVSESDYTAAKTTVDVAQANHDSSLATIRRTEGSLNQARDQLTKTVIYSPIDGKVSSLATEVGERVAGTGSYGGTEIMRVADLDSMEVRVNVNENDIVNVKVGDKARITIDAFPNRKFTGEVKEIGAAAKVTGQNTQDEVTNFLVKIRILDKDVPLRPSMSANADIETKTVENVVAVPIQSITVRSKQGAKTIEEVAADRQKKTGDAKGEGAATAVNVKQQNRDDRADRENLQRVAFVRRGDIVKMVNVETGLQDTTHIEVTSGLKEGDEVVSGSFGVITRTLKDGMKVQIEPAKKAAPKK
ncbi:efflux RND transporter periplasmic adaptor subunit [Opitutus sp. ER46]|uniref:efflux RND transporter periplasmic adaptor subunit n=1 Tax=Opitutus sp. ER46 TaxID=2161864 RepID=UPI001E30B0CD|nr:efflux RND transporter periplasmic adaptor subunit [Opitutus sp. ER46]